MKASYPLSEATRLQALYDYDVLDTAPETTFDDLCRIATLLCQTPIAAIGLIDDRRQWFKARIGLPMSEIRRDDALCAHAILQSAELTQVDDARADPRFADSALVSGAQQVRFYAAAALVSPKGEAIGTLTVMEPQVRSLTPLQGDALRMLARQVVLHLEARRVLAQQVRMAVERQHHLQLLEQHQRQLESLNTELQEQGTADGMTGLRNRRALEHILINEISRVARFDTTLSLLLVDLDHFRQYNERFGPEAGDDALRHIARLLLAHARPYDHVARYAGEEFVVVLPNTEAQEAMFVAERLRHAIESSTWAQQPISSSIGVATTDPAQDDAALVSHAELAMREARQRGGNQIVHFDAI